MSEKILHINSDEFESIVTKSDIPVIVDFYSEDCAPCEVLAPIYEKMAEKYGGHIKFVKILRQANRNFAKSLNVSSSPTVLFYKNGKEVGTRLNGFMNKPQVRQAIEEILGDVIPKEDMKRVDCDVLILGAGAAGLSAAIYASRANMNTVIIDESVPGGQTASTYHVANYPGTPGVVRGKEIINNMREQAKSFRARIDDLKEIAQVNLNDKIKYVRTEDTEYYAKALIIASGAKPRALPAEQADEFKGRGVHYCATCDGSMYQDRKIVVVGGGNSAVEEAVFLTKFASHVTIIHQFDNFQASKTAQEEAFKNPKIDIIWDSEVRKVNGQGHALTSVVIENLKTKELSEVPTEGAFVYIGTEPMSKMYEGQLEIDKWGYIVAAEDTKTSIDGVFAAGDIRTKLIRQVVTAASDGAIAGIMAERYVVSNKS
ncbi:thioredoxin-disulfide reductase [Acetivibrio cellulolyticus]|uniref:thioredoxin-disulfide reductase n=1 Tax=Acetivibrio cellulolyticus TaxID=35830 RepID=UPI0001E2D118|nr:thioredoxin-disulfide reductase [Acetivibrio cellulolyticus]